LPEDTGTVSDRRETTTFFAGDSTASARLDSFREKDFWKQNALLRILKLDESGNILRKIDIGADICGHTFVDGLVNALGVIDQVAA
jgi:hypothetical protein